MHNSQPESADLGSLAGIHITQYQLSSEDVLALAEADQTRGGQVWAKLMEKMLMSDRQAIETTPRIDTENITQDIKFRLGALNRIKLALSLPQVARLEIEHADTNKER